MTQLQTPSGETEPPIDAEQPESGRKPPQPPTRAGIRLGRFDGLEQHELITLLDEINTEQARARFREAIYLAIIFWLIFGLSVVYVPKYFWHPPHIINAPDKQSTMTYLDTPPDLQKQLKRITPAPHISQRSTEAQSPKPSPQAPEPKAGSPAPPAPRPTPQPAQQQPQQQAAPQPQQQPPPQQARNTPPAPTPPQPRNQPLADAPAPSPNRSIFNGQQSAGDAVREAARGSRSAAELGDYGSTGRGQNGGMKQGVQIISDTQGVDFAKYLARLLADIRRNWLPLIPEECRPPLNKQGITGVRFTILPDGRIAPNSMKLDYSTHDQAIDRAAWGSITGLGQAQPLPKEFHGPNLELRIEFRINKDTADAQ